MLITVYSNPTVYVYTCIQTRLDVFCASQAAYSYARYNREKRKWRCYEYLDENEETAKECMGENGERYHCHRHADSSPYTQMHNEILAEIAKGCEGKQ